MTDFSEEGLMAGAEPDSYVRYMDSKAEDSYDLFKAGKEADKRVEELFAAQWKKECANSTGTIKKMLTFEKWSKLGFKIIKGSKAHKESGLQLFDETQVTPVHWFWDINRT